MISPVKILVATALAATVAEGHGWMSKPEAIFSNEAGDKTQFIGSIDSASTGFKGSFSTAPADNVASFTKAFAASKYKTLKALIDDKTEITVSGATLTCGTATPDGTPQPLPAKLEWAHSDSEGFTPSHEGPCEAWCDTTRVFQDENCAANFKTAPAVMPYESSKCSGASMLTFYWIAMHGPSWQVYVNCAPLSGGSGAAMTAGSSTTESSSASTPATGSSSGSTPAATSASQTPSSGGSPSTPTVTSAPSTGTTPSTASPPSSNMTPSTSTTAAPSTGATADSECGSYDVAGSDSDCGSYDVAGSDSECGSYDVAGASGDEAQNTGSQLQNTGGSNLRSGDTTQQTDTYQGTGSQTSFNFNTVQGTTSVGTVWPQKM